MDELTLIISQNYHIINDEVRPLGDNIVEKDDNKYKVEPGYALAILSLLIILPIGYFFWYITILLIFKKAEEPNKDSKDDWNTQEELKNELAILSAVADLYKGSMEKCDKATEDHNSKSEELRTENTTVQKQTVEPTENDINKKGTYYGFYEKLEVPDKGES